VRVEGRPAPLVEMLLTTPTSHGRLQLQVERSAPPPHTHTTHTQGTHFIVHAFLDYNIAVCG